MKKITLILLLLTVIVGSCDFSPDGVGSANWEVNMFGPLAKTDMQMSDMLKLQKFEFAQSFTPAQFSLPTGTFQAFPPIPGLQIGPVDSPIKDQPFESVLLSSGNVKITIENGFPINIKSGAVILIESGGNQIINHTIPQNINPSGGKYETSMDIANKTIGKSVKITISNAGSDGSSTPITVSGQEKLTVSLKIENLIFTSMIINTINPIIFASDTTPFNMRGEVIKTQLASGVLNVYFVNQLPVSFKVQVNFMDESRINNLASAFADSVTIEAAGIEGERERKYTINIDENLIDVMNKAKYIKFDVTINTVNNQIVTIYPSNKIKMNLVADIKLKVNQKQ